MADALAVQIANRMKQREEASAAGQQAQLEALAKLISEGFIGVAKAILARPAL